MKPTDEENDMTIKASGVEPGQRRLNGIQTTGREYRNLTEPTFEIDRTNDVPIETRDGTVLLGDVYRPNSDQKFPALVSFSCYPRQIQDLGAPVGFIEAGATDFFVPRGYVQIIANARGTGGSEGSYSMFDKQEWQDIADVVEWAGAQPWCDGTVGMLGISYFACAQLAAAVERPEHLKAIFAPVVTENLYDVAWHHGLQSSGFMAPWLSAVGVMAGKTNKLWDSKKLDVVRRVMNTPAIHRKMANFNGEAIVTVLKNVIRTPAAQEPFGRLWQQACVEHPTHDDFWAARDTTPGLADVDIPVYLGCDWDNVPMHLPATFTTWRALAHNPNVRMGMVDDGQYSWPWEAMHYEALAWYDQHLKGIDTGIMDGDPIRYYLPGADEWRTAVNWPPADSSIVEFALRADGGLSPQEGEPGIRSYLYLPANSGQPAHMNPRTLPDRLEWQTEPLTSAMDFAGDIELQLNASITALDAAWMTVLYDVAPDGTAKELTAGWLRAMLREVNEKRSVPGAPVLDCDHPVAVPVGETVNYRIPLVPNARRIAAGHRLRIVLTSSDQAKGAPTALGFTHTPIAEPSLNTVSSSSRLLLPVLRTD
jgi:putative CocE/NonD family hydrolase